MRLTYTQHARDQMAERHISEDEVERVIARHYWSDYSRSTGNELYRGRPNGRHITVVVEPGSHPPHVVTVWD